VAAPVFNRHGYPVASVWAIGPTERMPRADLPAVGARVREQAGLISGRLGFGALDRNGNGKQL
jgi:IclR family acetate operon transcriptional repressor